MNEECFDWYDVMEIVLFPFGTFMWLLERMCGI